MAGPFLSDALALGFAAEVTFGTPVVPASWLPTVDADANIQKDNHLIVPKVAQQLSSPYGYAVQGVATLNGPVRVPILPSGGLGLLFGALGTDSISGAGPTYLHTLVLRLPGSNLQSFTLEKNVGGNNESVQYAGALVSKALLKFDPNAWAEATYTFDAQQDAILSSAHSYSAPADIPFDPTELAVTWAATQDTTLQSLEIEIDNGTIVKPAFNGQKYPKFVQAGSRKVTAKMRVIVQAMSGGAGASFGYYADLATPTARAIVVTITQGSNVFTMTLPAAQLTKLTEVLKVGDLAMYDLEYQAILVSGAEIALTVTNTRATAYY